MRGFPFSFLLRYLAVITPDIELAYLKVKASIVSGLKVGRLFPKLFGVKDMEKMTNQIRQRHVITMSQVHDSDF